MSRRLHALAVDLDGTLTHSGLIAPATLDALRQIRGEGVATILVTGRSREDLGRYFPRLTEHFDDVVTDNGCVLAVGGVSQYLAEPVDERLRWAMVGAGIELEVGDCLLSCDGAHRHLVVELIEHFGLDAQLLLNRGRLMVLPAGVTKATGLLAALHRLGLSRHNAMAVGDAENDLAMLTTAQMGVAVANAAPSVKAVADLVLEAPDGEGVRRLLTQDWQGTWAARQKHTRDDLTIGRFEDGEAACVPATTPNILISGESGSGKSYLAGLLVEALSALDFRVLVVDIEGDYLGLRHLPDVVVFSGHEPPDELVLESIMRWGGQSVVVDLSVVDRAVAAAYLARLPGLIASLRELSGMPHWVILDEAHSSLGSGGTMEGALGSADEGFVFVTYRPGDLPRADVPLVGAVISVHGVPPGADHSDATLRLGDGPARTFVADPRQTSHARHWHKYTALPMTASHWFTFTDADGREVAIAHSVAEFAHLLRELPYAVVRRHVHRGDVSRWIADLGSRELEVAVREVADPPRWPADGDPESGAGLADTISSRLVDGLIDRRSPPTADAPDRTPSDAPDDAAPGIS